MKLSGKKAIVTGGSKSIGQAIALQLAKEGADVVISFNTHEKEAQNTISQLNDLGSNSHAFKADFSNSAEIVSFAEKAIQFLDGVDILINNAAIVNRDTFFQLSPEQLTKTFQINTFAPLQLTQLCAEAMCKQKRGGCIINISSIASLITNKRGAAYAASKAALNKLTQNMALELSPYHIRVNAVSPGVIEAGMNANTAKEDPARWENLKQQIPLGEFGKPQNISDMVLFLASEQATWITGKIFEVDGGQLLN